MTMIFPGGPGDGKLPAIFDITVKDGLRDVFTGTRGDGESFTAVVAELDMGTHLARHVILTSMEDAREQGFVKMLTRYKFKRRDAYKQGKSQAIYNSLFACSHSWLFGLFDEAGDLVGWFNIKRSLTTPYVIGFGMVVEEEYRGQGIGNAAVQYLASSWSTFAREDGIIGIMGSTRADNTAGNKRFATTKFVPISLAKDLDGDVYINYIAGDVDEITRRMLDNDDVKRVHHLLADPRLKKLPMLQEKVPACDFRSMID